MTLRCFTTELHGISGCSALRLSLTRRAASPRIWNPRSTAIFSILFEAYSAKVNPWVNSRRSRAVCSMSQRWAASLSSGGIHHLMGPQDLAPAERVANGVSLHEIDLAAQNSFQFLLHFDEVPGAPGRLGIERHQHVHVARRREILAKH